MKKDNQTPTRKIKFIDLFAGIGGIRCGFEQAAKSYGFETECVFTSEIKPYAVEVLKQNYPNEVINGDITKIPASEIPDFDFLFGGFPCQSFSAAGKRLGFLDTRGTLFFEIERILRDKKPFGFILENVEGLINHDKVDKKANVGRTLSTILARLDELGYNVEWKLLNSKNFGLAQERKRVYIVGTKTEKPSLENFVEHYSKLKSVIEEGQPIIKTKFTDLLLTHFSVEQLYGKSIKDKRGGKNNIHSWDIEFKGPVSEEQKKILNTLFKERRKKKWAQEFGIDWMDGMPLTLEQISSFFKHDNLKGILEDLVKKGYLKKEHPKRLVKETNLLGEIKTIRKQDRSLPLGYNIVSGKLSFEVNKILCPNDIAPTLVAMDMKKLFVVDNGGLRTLTLKEGLKLFGFPENYKFNISTDEGYDLLGNTVTVPIVKAVSERLLTIWKKQKTRKHETNSTRSFQQVNA
ncbi:MAG TPA: DNA (cytosine-5-)-methyltransferase [Bacteroidales bacterium]|nr:DNA (cytosine-5-)-methyltransferase [Bacteroidales bacterium]